MTQTVYPFDPHGTNGACYIKNEANSLLSSFGTHRCVIPKAAPFYKKDFVAVSGGRTLVEGVDFYFGHQYVRGTHQTAQAIYGSIYILNSAVTTPLTLTYRTLGGQYTTTDVKITTYLANSLTDPTTARWEDVITDLYFPPVDIDYNIDTYRDEKDLASVLASVGTAIVAQDPKADDRINLYESWLDEETNIVTESQWEQHLHNRDETVTIETPDTQGDIVDNIAIRYFSWKTDDTDAVGYIEDIKSWKVMRADSTNYVYNDPTYHFNSTDPDYLSDARPFNKTFSGVLRYDQWLGFFETTVTFNDIQTMGQDGKYNGLNAALNYDAYQNGKLAIVLKQYWDDQHLPHQLAAIYDTKDYTSVLSIWYNFGRTNAVKLASINQSQNGNSAPSLEEAGNSISFRVKVSATGLEVQNDTGQIVSVSRTAAEAVYGKSIEEKAYFGIGGLNQPYIIASGIDLYDKMWNDQSAIYIEPTAVTYRTGPLLLPESDSGRFSDYLERADHVQMALPLAPWTVDGADLTYSDENVWFTPIGDPGLQAYIPNTNGVTLRGAGYLQGILSYPFTDNFYTTVELGLTPENSGLLGLPSLGSSNPLDDPYLVIAGLYYSGDDRNSVAGNEAMDRFYGIAFGEVPGVTGYGMYFYSQDLSDATTKTYTYTLTPISTHVHVDFRKSGKLPRVTFDLRVNENDPSTSILSINWDYFDSSSGDLFLELGGSISKFIPNHQHMRFFVGGRDMSMLTVYHYDYRAISEYVGDIPRDMIKYRSDGYTTTVDNRHYFPFRSSEAFRSDGSAYSELDGAKVFQLAGEYNYYTHDVVYNPSSGTFNFDQSDITVRNNSYDGVYFDSSGAMSMVDSSTMSVDKYSREYPMYNWGVLSRDIFESFSFNATFTATSNNSEDYNSFDGIDKYVLDTEQTGELTIGLSVQWDSEDRGDFVFARDLTLVIKPFASQGYDWSVPASISLCLNYLASSSGNGQRKVIKTVPLGSLLSSMTDWDDIEYGRVNVVLGLDGGVTATITFFDNTTGEFPISISMTQDELNTAVASLGDGYTTANYLSGHVYLGAYHVPYVSYIQPEYIVNDPSGSVVLDPGLEFEGSDFNKPVEYVWELEPTTPGTTTTVNHGTNPHKTMWYQAGALKSDGIAQNTEKLKNLTIDQLTTQARDTQGIQISKYFPLDAERVLTGDLILADGRAGISRKATDGSKEALIQLSTGNSHVNGDRNVTIIADQKRERVGTSASLKSGANVLKVVSSGPDQEPDQLFFNNQLVLTTETLKDHLPLDVNASVNVVTENTAEMTFSGKGSTLDPLKVTFNYPTGTTALRGLVRLTSTLDNSQPAYAGTPAAVKTLNDRLANLIPNTRKVNGMALTGPIVITKSQLSIQYVENLADMDYPVYPQYQVELDKYSVTNHSHNIDDFDINAATSSVAGVVKYAYNVGSGTTTALNSYVYQLLSNRLGGMEASVNTKVPANALKLNKYGAATYLPVPAVATYPAAGPNTASLTIVGEVELDGTLVILRNGSDIIDSGVYYAYMTLDADGAITKYTATTTQYAPSFLPAGVTARAVYRGSEGVFILRDSTDAYWVVLTNNTMESKYHVGSKLLGTMPYGQQLMPIIVDDSVYFIYTNLSTTEYAFKAWKVPKASIGTGTLTVTAQTFTGTDAYGNAQTNVATYTLVPGGISTDPTAKVLAIDTSGGKWTTRNVRRGQLNYDVVAEGTSVRVMIYVSSYFANATTSMWKYFTTSFVIDFAAKSAAVDLPAGFPLVYSATDLTTTLPKGGVDKGFPFAQANNYAGVIRSAGKRFAYFYYGIELIPAIRAFKYTYSGTEIQQIKDVNVSSAALGATYSILGNYGSPVHMNCKGYHLIKGNRYIAVNEDGTYVMGEYSPTTRYIAGDAGYGPTTNRTSITQAKFESLKRTLFNASTGQSDGVVLMDDLLTVNSKYDPSTDVQSAPVSISTAEFNALKALFFAQVPTADAGTRFIKSKLSVYVPNDATLPVLGVYVYRAYTDDTSTTAAGKVIIAQLSVGSRTTLAGVALDYVIYTYTFNSTAATDISDYSPAIAGSCVSKLADGTVVYTLQTNAAVNNVGSSGTPGFMMVYTPSNSTWVKVTPYSMVNYYVNGRYITSDRGLFALSAHSSGEGAVMSLLGTTLTEINNGATLGSGIFNSSRVAEGWYVYLTEPMSYVANGIRYTLPTQTMDLRTYFPSAYQNRTLYLFADIQGGTAKYVWSSVKNPDSTTATYIGYCKTGTDRITELALERVTRLGDFKELVDHQNSIVAHGVSNNTQATIGLPLVENRAPAYELDTSVFSEVFNSWKQISHAPADYTQPANATEAAAWAYSAATDTISCTMNTATYVGFVSPNKIADYEFDTVVGVPATSADGDNDAISIIIGYVEVNGVQRTLSVVRSRSIEAHLKVTTQFGIYYDYQLPDQLSVKTVDTTASETVGPWRGYYSRIHVKRVGNTFTVKATKLDTKTYSSVTDADYIFNMTFTLDDLPELAIFKGPIQYGYGAISQTDAAYINYLRPDADGRNYYGTTIEAMKALYWQRNAVIQSGIIAHGGVLPIPAGLTRDQCRYYLTIDKLLNGTASSAIQDINLTYDPTTYVVTASFTRADGSTIAGNAAYTVLAAPGFKLFN